MLHFSKFFFALLLSVGLLFTPFYTSKVDARNSTKPLIPNQEILLEENKNLKHEISLLERKIYRLELALQDTDFFTIKNTVKTNNNAEFTEPEQKKTIINTTEKKTETPPVFITEVPFQTYTNKNLSFDYPKDWQVENLGPVLVTKPIINQAQEVDDTLAVMVYAIETEANTDIEKSLKSFQDGYIEGFYNKEDHGFSEIQVTSSSEKFINKKPFKRLVIQSKLNGKEHKQYMIFGINKNRIYGLSFAQELTAFNQNWEVIERIYNSFHFYEENTIKQEAKTVRFSDENFEFDYTNNWAITRDNDMIMLLSPAENEEDRFQENIVLTHETLTAERVGLKENALLGKMLEDDKTSFDSFQIIDESTEDINGVLFTKQLTLVAIDNTEAVVIHYAYSDGKNAYFVTYTALPESVEKYGDQFKQILKTLTLPQTNGEIILNLYEITESLV